ncbi:hypothetical protein PR048_002022 [Dryococelus australis]|uniref:Fascin-like domain-containing protein n=1 Tax=Dryococelus australis TaxID=614101 RepID=A0ABQ9IJP8_9NEOP|nr:hypothetical protein PR048_002022 [Dryococelus australis]
MLMRGYGAHHLNMNGVNGHGVEMNGGDLLPGSVKACWTIGLINSKFRYLTAETFGFKINANGASLKKKQVWTLEPASSGGGDTAIFLRSHLDKYLAVDSFGNVACEGEERETGCRFHISVAADGSGRWALRNEARGYFLGASADKLTCTAKAPGDAELWLVHLAARPQYTARCYFRGASAGKLTSTTKAPGDTELWLVLIAARLRFTCKHLDTQFGCDKSEREH